MVLSFLVAAISMRGFGKLSSDLHTRLPFNVCKKTRMTVVTGFMEDQEKTSSCDGDEGLVLVMEDESSGTNTGRTEDDGSLENVSVLLSFLEGSRLGGFQLQDWDLLSRVRSVSIPDNLEELCDRCFFKCESLFRVTFSESSSLKRIGIEAFSRSGVKEIRIPDRVEELCYRCFCKCKNLSRVAFGESSLLKCICFKAFHQCTHLTEIHIPNSVERLGGSCFRRCKNLSTVIFGERSSLKCIWSAAFSNCYKLTEIRIPDGVEEIPGCCFWSDESLLRVTFGEESSLKRMQSSALWHCPLKEIRIPNSVQDIEDDCFNRCLKLARVVFGELSVLKSVGSRAFTRCRTLTEIDIPDSVETLGEDCFSGCRHLLRVNFCESSSLTSIGPACFDGTALVHMSLPETLVSVGGGAFLKCHLRDSLTYHINSPFTVLCCLLLSNNGRFCHSPSEQLKEVVIPDCVEEICDKCFCGDGMLSVRFGESQALKRIGNNAFQSCCELREIRIPDSVEELGSKCFSGCENLSCVTFGESSSLKRIGFACFCSCGIDRISLPESVVSVGGGLFSECTLSGVTCHINAPFKVLDYWLLSKDERVCYGPTKSSTYFVVPDSVEDICDGCFYECLGLSSIKFGESPSVRRTGVDAFWGCWALDEIFIPDTGKSTG